jgi:hypothetical protein
VFEKDFKIIEKGRYEVMFWDDSIQEKSCVCWGRVNKWYLTKKMSTTYYLCCEGHIKYFLKILIGKKVTAKSISSAITSHGKENCRFELTENK